MNGQQVGSIKGAFIRGIFDISSVVKPGEKAALAVFFIGKALKQHTGQRRIDHCGPDAKRVSQLRVRQTGFLNRKRFDCPEFGFGWHPVDYYARIVVELLYGSLSSFPATAFSVVAPVPAVPQPLTNHTRL